MTVSAGSCRKAERIAAKIRIKMMGLLNWAKNNARLL
jgi:hypothetical protein